MIAVNTPTSKALRILDNIMEGNTEWFAKDEQHNASLEFAKQKGDYEIITAKFYRAAACVRKLNFVDIDDAIGYLADNHYYNVAGKPTEEPATTAEARCPFAGFIGKQLHVYDSWYGDSRKITIRKAEKSGNRVRFTETDNNLISVPEEYIQDLLQTGYAEYVTEVDHCNVTTRWNLI